MRKTMSVYRSVILSVTLSLFAVLSYLPAALAGPAVQGMPAPREIGPKMSCGVCMMYPARFPKWQSEIIFADGAMVPFDGCKDLFKYLLDMGRYTSDHTAADVRAVWVKDFPSGEWLMAKNATFVVGSEMMGPMGKELIPFRDPNAAAAFQKEYGGTVMAYDAVTLDTVKPLSMGMGMGGMHGMGGGHGMKNMKDMNGMKGMDGMRK